MGSVEETRQSPFYFCHARRVRHVFFFDCLMACEIERRFKAWVFSRAFGSSVRALPVFVRCLFYGGGREMLQMCRTLTT